MEKSWVFGRALGLLRHQGVPEEVEYIFHGNPPLTIACLLSEKVRGHTIRQARESMTDPVTGLWNHRFFYRALERELSESVRYERPLSVHSVDVNNFKALNDSRGHLAGDEALTQIGQGLKAALRGSDIVCRLGGDEYGIILPDTDPEGAYKLAQEYEQRVQPVLDEWGVSLSIGIASFEPRRKGELYRTDQEGAACRAHMENEAHRLYEEADSAMYIAKGIKANGRNNIAFYDPFQEP